MLTDKAIQALKPREKLYRVADWGDDSHAKDLVLGLIDALGFDGVDAGSLADSWRQHPGTPAYCQDLDADQLKTALAQADAARIADYRAQADEIARPYFV